MNSDPCRFRKISKLKPRPKKKISQARLASYPGLPLLCEKIRTYQVTDVTDCGQFQECGRTPTHSEHANTGLTKIGYTQGG